MTKEYVKGLIPWLLYFIFSDYGYAYIGIILAFVSIIALIIPHLRKGLLLDWGTLIFFFILGGAMLIGLDYWVKRYGVLMGNAAVALIAVISLLAEKPFTWQYAKAYSQSGYADSPVYIHVHRMITCAWAGVFILSGLSHAMYLDHMGDYVWMNEIIPVILIILGMVFSLVYPNLYKRRFHLGGISRLKGIRPVEVLKISGGQVPYRTLGEGIPLLLLPDVYMSMHLWDPELIYELSHDHRLILLDYPEVGQGRFNGDLTTARGIANYVIHFLNETESEPVSILGYGLGGWIAQDIALQYPEKVARLVLIASDCGGEQAIRGQRDLSALLPTSPYYSEENAQHSIKRLFPEGVHEEYVKKLHALYKAGAMEPQYNHKALEYQEALVQRWYKTGTFDHLDQLAHPMLIAGGDKDQLVPIGNAEVLAERAQNTHVVRYPQAGHGLIYQDPFELASNIKGFLAALASR